jgi:hypothetical protein
MVMGHWVTDEMGRSDIAPNTASSGTVRGGLLRQSLLQPTSIPLVSAQLAPVGDRTGGNFVTHSHREREHFTAGTEEVHP